MPSWGFTPSISAPPSSGMQVEAARLADPGVTLQVLADAPLNVFRRPYLHDRRARVLHVADEHLRDAVERHIRRLRRRSVERLRIEPLAREVGGVRADEPDLL